MLVSRRYERHSIFGDAVAATVILDRLLHDMRSVPTLEMGLTNGSL